MKTKIKGKAVKTRELDKMIAVKPRADIIAGFLDWMDENKLVIATYQDLDGEEHDFPRPDGRSKEKLLAAFFEIDLDKCERERQAILDAIRGKP